MTDCKKITDNSDNDTKKFLAKFSGVWKGSDSAEEIIAIIKDRRKNGNPVSFD